MLITFYIILIIVGLISGFASVSKGYLFRNTNIGAFISLIHIIVLIVFVIVAAIKYSTFHILYMPFVSFVVSWIIPYLIKKGYKK